MTPLERLLAETIPTRPSTPTPSPRPAARPWTVEEQAQHLAGLAAALNGWRWEDDTSLSKRRREQRRRRAWLASQPSHQTTQNPPNSPQTMGK